MSALLAVLATYVGLELCHRVRHGEPGARNAWLMAAAIALVCGIWGGQVLTLAAQPAAADLGLHPGLTISAVLAALTLCVLALNLSITSAPGWMALLGAAALLGLATLAAQALLWGAASLTVAAPGPVGRLISGWALCSIGFAAALLAFLPLGPTDSSRLRPRQLGAAALATLGLLACQSIGPGAAEMSAAVDRQEPGATAAAAVAAAAWMGGGALLLLMWMACAVEVRLRRRKVEATGARPRQEAFRDSLTRLPTRNTFEGTLSQALVQADVRKQAAVLLHIALDGFKHINDNFGHDAGDAVLKSAAQRLAALASPYHLARLGGDEFLMLLDGEDAAHRAQGLAAQVLDSIAQPCQVAGRELTVTTSIGMAVYPQHGAMSALITHATIATRASKAAGGATYSMFDTRMADSVRDQAELLRDLRQALSLGQLELYYQPKIHAPSAQVNAAEALLRWHHPQRGMISPTVFIPMAESHGLITTLGAWVIDEACRQARVWRDQGLRMRVAVNLSAHQLRQSDLPARISAALAKHQINPDLLTCEITESVAMEDTEATMRFFSELAAAGVHISIDDFGAGYSSLAYLRKLPATELKIDRSFVLDLEHSEEARKIAEAVVQLAQALNLKVVAEGVETDAQYQILRRLGCDQVQGFLFARPMSAKALALWAMGDDGPRSIAFRESLFKETAALEA